MTLPRSSRLAYSEMPMPSCQRIFIKEPPPTPVASKEPEKGKNYFGLYLLVGGLKPYTMESDIETTIPLAKTGTWPKASDEADGNTVGRSLVFSGCIVQYILVL